MVTENKDIAKNPESYNLDDPDEALKLLESWGRIQGTVHSFGNAQEDQFIHTSCAVYDSVDGAKEAFSYKTDDERFLRSEVEKEGGSQFEFRRLDGISIGDETRAHKYGYVNSALNPAGTRIHMSTISFRAQFVLCSYIWGSIGSGILSEELASKGLREGHG